MEHELDKHDGAVDALYVSGGTAFSAGRDAELDVVSPSAVTALAFDAAALLVGTASGSVLRVGCR